MMKQCFNPRLVAFEFVLLYLCANVVQAQQRHEYSAPSYSNAYFLGYPQAIAPTTAYYAPTPQTSTYVANYSLGHATSLSYLPGVVYQSTSYAVPAPTYSFPTNYAYTPTITNYVPVTPSQFGQMPAIVNYPESAQSTSLVSQSPAVSAPSGETNKPAVSAPSGEKNKQSLRPVLIDPDTKRSFRAAKTVPDNDAGRFNNSKQVVESGTQVRKRYDVWDDTGWRSLSR